MTNQSDLNEVLKALGTSLGFEVKAEVEASDSAWVDMVWFDERFPLKAARNLHLRYAPVLPIVGFEIERHTGLNAKHIKGSVSNLSNLGAQLGVIVVGQANLDALARQPNYANKKPKDLRQLLCERVYRWVYAEAQPRVRIIVMFENEVRDWAEKVRSFKPQDGTQRKTELE